MNVFNFECYTELFIMKMFHNAIWLQDRNTPQREAELNNWRGKPLSERPAPARWPVKEPLKLDTGGNQPEEDKKSQRVWHREKERHFLPLYPLQKAIHSRYFYYPGVQTTAKEDAFGNGVGGKSGFHKGLSEEYQLGTPSLQPHGAGKEHHIWQHKIFWLLYEINVYCVVFPN